MKQPPVLITFNNTSDKLTNDRTVYHTLEQLIHLGVLNQTLHVLHF